MPKAAPTQNTIFNEAYEPLGTIRNDRHSLLHHNSSDTLSFYPGEPFPKNQGAGAVVAIAQSLIKPGETKSVLVNWKANFPCDFSAVVRDGDEVYWDTDTEKVALAADVTNGFSLGFATFELEPAQKVSREDGDAVLTADTDEIVVVADADSTRVEVVCSPGFTTLKGTASALSNE